MPAKRNIEMANIEHAPSPERLGSQGVSKTPTMWGCLQCGMYFVTAHWLNRHWNEQGGVCARKRIDANNALCDKTQ